MTLRLLFVRVSSSTSVTALLALAAVGCDGSAQPPTDPPEQTCPSIDGAGTRHARDVTTDEVWRAEDGPHHVDASVVVRDGATLRIEPCAELRFAAGASLDVGAHHAGERARLVAVGEAARPIRMLRASADPWSSLAVFAPSSATLAHVTIDGAGSDAFREHASVWIAGDGAAPSEGQLELDELTVTGSAGHGVVAIDAGGFVAGSRALVVHGAGAEQPGSHPVVVGQHALASLPDGDLTGNARDEVWVREDLANGYVGLQHDVRMPKLSVPYRIGSEDGEPMRIGSNAPSGFATLTIDPGVELRFHPGVALRVLATGELGPRGAIRALGTPDAPVVFTSASDAPSPGDWPGLYFEAPVSDSNELAHVEIAFAGGYCSCSLVSCSPVETYDAAIVIDGEAPARGFLRDALVRDSAGHGVLRSWLDAADVDFLESNRFERVAGCAQTSPMLSEVVCPSDEHACDR
jgi:hypothetical protein